GRAAGGRARRRFVHHAACGPDRAVAVDAGIPLRGPPAHRRCGGGPGAVRRPAPAADPTPLTREARVTPRVSVVMATHDHAPYVAQAIRSVLDQTFRDFEFLIVNDGSQVGTPRVSAQMNDQLMVI